MSSSTQATEQPQMDRYSVQYILPTIQKHIKEWEQLKAEHISIRRMSGMSNACFKVEVNDSNMEVGETRSVLFRIFECELTDTHIETALFNTLSD